MGWVKTLLYTTAVGAGLAGLAVYSLPNKRAVSEDRPVDLTQIQEVATASVAINSQPVLPSEPSESSPKKKEEECLQLLNNAGRVMQEDTESEEGKGFDLSPGRYTVRCDDNKIESLLVLTPDRNSEIPNVIFSKKDVYAASFNLVEGTYVVYAELEGGEKKVARLEVLSSEERDLGTLEKALKYMEGSRLGFLGRPGAEPLASRTGSITMIPSTMRLGDEPYHLEVLGQDLYSLPKNKALAETDVLPNQKIVLRAKNNEGIVRVDQYQWVDNNKKLMSSYVVDTSGAIALGGFEVGIYEMNVILRRGKETCVNSLRINVRGDVPAKKEMFFEEKVEFTKVSSSRRAWPVGY